MSDKFDENNENQDIVNDIISGLDEQSKQIMNELDENSDSEITEEDFTEEITDDIPQSVYDDDENDESAGEYDDAVEIPEKPKRDKSRKKIRKKKKKRKRSRLPGVLILVTLIFGVSIISSMVIIGYGKDMLGIGKSDETHLLVVPEGATTEEIALMLENDGIIRSAKAFIMFADLRDKGIGYIVGEHFIRPNMPYETLINELTQLPTEELGESIEVTFPEGVTLLEASYILEEKGICDAEDFVFYFNSGGFGLSF